MEKLVLQLYNIEIAIKEYLFEGFTLTLILIGCLLNMLSSFKIFKYSFVMNSVSFSLIVYQHSTGSMSNVRSGHVSSEQHKEYISRK